MTMAVKAALLTRVPPSSQHRGSPCSTIGCLPAAVRKKHCSVVRQCPRQPSPTAKQAPGPFDFVGEGGKGWGSATFAEPDLELSVSPHRQMIERCTGPKQLSATRKVTEWRVCS